MKINFAQPALNLDGTPIKDEKGNELIFSKQIGNFIFQTPDKENALASYELAKKIYNSTGEEEFTKAEVEKIKEKVKENFISGFAGQIFEIILEADKKG